MTKAQPTAHQAEAGTDDTAAVRVKPTNPVFSGSDAPTHAVRANGRPVTQVFGQPELRPPQMAADHPLGEDGTGSADSDG